MASQDWVEKDFYRILGVAKDVSDADLKKTYRKLAREFHPDANPGNPKAEDRFKDISEAYSVLSDPAQRREYDAIRAMGSGARFSAGSGGGSAGSGGFDDIFSTLFGAPGGFGTGGYSSRAGGAGASSGGFGGFGGFGGPTGPQSGQDLAIATTIPFIDSIHGTTKRIKVGTGELVTVKIPAGIEDGQKLKVRDKGQPSPNGGRSGDLILTINVTPHPVFSRDGDHVRLTLPITFAEAILGATVPVPTLGGEPVKLKIAPGTPNGRTFRIKELGVRKAARTGDLLVTVDVVVPSRISADAEKHLRALVEVMPQEDPRGEILEQAGRL